MKTTPMWRHSVDRCDGRATVALTGELDVSVRDDLRALLLSEITRTGTKRVEADLSGVTFMDSSAIGSLVTAHSVAYDHGNQFLVANASHRVRRVLEITGLFEVLTVH
ncbi:STAS domain-containing protein [Actinoplanes sp. NPDC051859]|uniref:STAS domain-containing protein n=1 Tax=Actinoplanes sp. NPDC051859 TaxID=3363909 RepID=UPI003791CD00